MAKPSVALFLWLTSFSAWAEIAVTVVDLSTQSITRQNSYSATVEPLDTSALSAGLSAEILALDVRPGDRVNQGDRLALLDCRDAHLGERVARADHARTEVELEFAKRQAERIAKLAASNIASEELKDTRATDVERARQAFEMADARLAEALLQVSRCEVRAPFDAVVTAQLASQGTRVAVGTPILEVVSQTVEVRARVPVTLDVESFNRVTFVSDSREIPLTQVSVGGAVESETATRLVRFVARDHRLEPGLPGRIRVYAEGQFLPADFLVERDGRLGVMVLDGARAAFIERPQAVMGQPVEITDLPVDLKVIENGRFRVRDGDAVVATP